MQRMLVKKLEHVMYTAPPEIEVKKDPEKMSTEDILLATRKDPLLAQEVYSALLAEVAPFAAMLAR